MSGLAVRVDIPEPGPIEWQRELGAGRTLVGTTVQANALEVSLLAAAFGEVPSAIAAKADVRTLVRSSDVPADVHPATLAFARGPDIYFLDGTFADATRLGMVHTIAHELTHVAQFNSLDSSLVDEVLRGNIDSLDPNDSNEAVRDFADEVGWRLSGGSWTPPDAGAGTTSYGLSGPSEDMAESVALVATGRANELSADRVRWVENWIGVSAANLATGKPWRPEGATTIASRDPIYDEEAVGRLGYRNTEPLYLLLPEDGSSIDDLAREVGRQLRGRGMAGVLDPIADDRLPRAGGRFIRPGGEQIWVEIWDFSAGTLFTNPPPGPVLTYVDVWN